MNSRGWAPEPHDALLSARGLRRAYGRRQVVRDVSFWLKSGEIVGLLGPNGAGKTTSFNMVAGLVAADAGEIRLAGQVLTHVPLHGRVRLGLGYLPQEATVFAGLTARENMLVALEATRVTGRAARLRAQEALCRAQLSHVVDTPGGALSGGERRRLEMARALLLAPKILLLDEPFAGVDPIAVADLKAQVQQIAQGGVGILLTDHNAQETLRLCHRVYLLAAGRLVSAGTPAQVVACPEARRLYLGHDFRL